jgi:hypothetical protein
MLTAGESVMYFQGTACDKIKLGKKTSKFVGSAVYRTALRLYHQTR